VATTWRVALAPLLFGALASAVVALTGCGGGQGSADQTRPAIEFRTPGATTATEGVRTPSATSTPAPVGTSRPSPAATPSTTPAPTQQAATQLAAPTTPVAPPGAVTIRLRAANLAFDQASVRARAGARVTAILQNEEPGVQHNLSFTVPGLPHGETCLGPCTETQTFTAPAPSRFLFFCTVHDMTGDFFVDP
jgi:plastocyanin